MDKKNRQDVLSKVDAKAWYCYCWLECNHGEHIATSDAKLARDMGITIETFKKHLKTLLKLGLVKRTVNGYTIEQLDGNALDLSSDGNKGRKFVVANDVLKLFCEVYEEHYGVEYQVGNFRVELSCCKRLLGYTDEQLEGGIRAAVTLYDTKWISRLYPRPTIKALASWLFQSALPFAVDTKKFDETNDEGENLLSDLETKGWI